MQDGVCGCDIFVAIRCQAVLPSRRKAIYRLATMATALRAIRCQAVEPSRRKAIYRLATVATAFRSHPLPSGGAIAQKDNPPSGDSGYGIACHPLPSGAAIEQKDNPPSGDMATTIHRLATVATLGAIKIDTSFNIVYGRPKQLRMTMLTGRNLVTKRYLEMSQATVVINAAGCGSRLKMNIPKSLVEVAGCSILEWQLNELCQSVESVRIVVGYMGETVARLARRLRPSIEVIFNEEWKTTKTAASLSLGMLGVAGRCVSLDGDLLVHPADFYSFVSAQKDLIGVSKVLSSQPVFAIVDDSEACVEMSYTKLSPYEWTGLVNFDPPRVAPAKNNVFEMIECLLPAAIYPVRCCEVDTAGDLLAANRDWPRYLNYTEYRHVTRYAG